MIFCLCLVIALWGSSLTDACRCGEKPASAARVINGEDAQPHAWPWQISFRYNGYHICGGSLIKPNWVVTAAHCVSWNPNPKNFTVVVGVHKLYGTTSVQATFRVTKIIQHKKFSMNHTRNDIALLQLEKPVRFSDKVSPVCLPTSDAPVGKDCYITGWGRTVAGGKLPDILQQAVLPVACHEQCSAVNGPVLIPVDKKSMLCAGGQGKGGCHGDSGGPFVCEQGGRWVLHGIVSWGHYECVTSFYSVFARVNTYVQWIDDNTVCKDKGKNRLCRKLKHRCSNAAVQAKCKKTCKLCH